MLLFNIELDSGTRYVGTRDEYIGGTHYRDCALHDSFSISQKMPNLFYGIAPPAEFSFAVTGSAEANLSWVEAFAIDEFRGRWVKVQHYDEISGLTFIAYGKINSASFGDTTVISTGTRDTILDTILPRATITTDEFDDTARDLGKPINICFGYCRDVPLYNIRWDLTNNVFDFLIGYGVIEGVNAVAGTSGVKRDGILSTPATVDSVFGYSVYNGSSWVVGSPTDTSNYNHDSTTYAFIRYEKDQTNWTELTYTADIKGLRLGAGTAQRNVAICIMELLQDSVWGLGDDINAASFAAAVVALSTTYYKCDGAIINQQSASNILNDLLMMSRSYLSRNASKEWEITVAAAGSSVGTFGYNDGHYNNIVSCGPLTTIPADEIISTIRVHYDLGLANAFDKPDTKDHKHFAEITHVIDANFGVEQVYELPFVREDETAEKFTSFITQAMLYSNLTMNLQLDMSGKNIRANDIITLEIPQRNLYANDFIVQSCQFDGIGKYNVTVRPYDDALYDDVVLTASSAWTPSGWYGGLYEIPYVTVSPTPGAAMFATIEDALAKLPSYARKIKLLKGTHAAPTSANFYTLPTTHDLEIVGESMGDVIVQNKAGYNLFYIGESSKNYRFSTFTIDSQNTSTGTKMIYAYGGVSSPANLSSKIVVEDVIFDLASGPSTDECGIYVKTFSGTLNVNRCYFSAGVNPLIVTNYDLWSAGDVSITNNKFTSPSDRCIQVFKTDFFHIGFNKIYDGTEYMIYVIAAEANSEGNTIIGNQLQSTDLGSSDIAGIICTFIKDTAIVENQISMTEEVGIVTYGIYVGYAEFCRINSNKVLIDNPTTDAVNRIGICIDPDSYYNTVDENIIDMTNSDAEEYGIYVYGDYNQGTNNVTVNCAQGVVKVGANNDVKSNDS